MPELTDTGNWYDDLRLSKEAEAQLRSIEYAWVAAVAALRIKRLPRRSAGRMMADDWFRIGAEIARVTNPAPPSAEPTTKSALRDHLQTIEQICADASDVGAVGVLKQLVLAQVRVALALLEVA